MGNPGLEVFDESNASLGVIVHTDGSPGLYGSAAEEFDFLGFQSDLPIHSAQFRKAFPESQAFGFGIDDLVFASGDPGPPRTTIELVPRGSDWSYLDDGSNQGTAWRDVGFTDSLWADGPAELGYGDDDEQTIVTCGPDAPACNNNNQATTYFRHTFQVEMASLTEDLSVWLLRDDAAAVYLNGTEVFRDDSLPADAAFNTYATSTGFENGAVTFNVDPQFLVDGDNVLAVEVHQASPTSSDVSFDLQLTALVNPIPEPSTLALSVLALLCCALTRRRPGYSQATARERC